MGGCLSISKVLDNRRAYPDAQLQGIINELTSISDSDPIHKIGQEIACLFMLMRGQKTLLDFGRFPAGSPPRKFESLCR